MATGRVPTTANSPLTAKGDLFGYSTAPARLAVGNNGESLVADSSTSTGLRYNPQNALVNPIINGGMDIWQRGTSVAGSGGIRVYTADRWQADTGSQLTFSRQAVNDSTNLPNIQYSARVQRTAGSTSVGAWNFVTSVETAMAVPLAGKTVTLSFYAKRGANYSATSNLLGANLYTGTGTDQNIYTGYTGSVTTTGSVTLTTSWQRFAIVYTFPSTMTEFALQFTQTPPASTAGADDWFEITGVQIDLGTYSATTAPSFRRSGGTIQGELAACQRYYVRSTGTGFMEHGGGTAWSTTRNYSSVQLPVTMRVAPTSIDYSTLALYNPSAASYAVTNLTINYAGTQRTNLDTTIGTASLTGNVFYTLTNNNSANGYLGFNAEL
jgi:hypothetical protein